MQTSESIKEISLALVGFHKEVGKIAKDASNPFFKSKYASLSNILDGIGEPLNKNGLAIVQFPEGENGLTTRLVHTSGEWMEANYQMKPSKDDPQGRGSALTYQRRYAIGAILSLNIDEDDDGNAASKPAAKATVKTELPWLNEGTPEWLTSVNWLLTKPANTIELLKSKWKISKDNEGKLKVLIQNKKPALNGSN